MSSRIKNSLDVRLARLQAVIEKGIAENAQALGRARAALAIIQELRAWERCLGPQRFPRWGEALRAAERGLATFLRDATAVIEGPRDGWKEPERCQRSTTRGGEAP